MSPAIDAPPVPPRAAAEDNSTAPSWLVWAALGVVYVVWGSTYLAIRVTVQTLPPLLTAGVRFTVAGVVAYLFLWARGGTQRVRVEAREILACTIVGTALLFGGNGLVTLAERSVPSALAALIIGSVPLWVVLLRALKGESVGRSTFVGVGIGFVGLSILVLPGSGTTGVPIGWMLLIVLASASWAIGSFMSRSLPLPGDPFVSTAVQMMTGGVVLLITGLIHGEASGLDFSSFSTSSIVALGYLIVAGSWLAFTAYVWLLQNAPISKVATYAFVNPVVAIFLGWWLLGEQITPVILLGATIIVLSVAAIVRKESSPGDS